jgi:hypothetical protein
MAEAAWKAFGTLDCDPTRIYMYEILAWPNEKKPSAVGQEQLFDVIWYPKVHTEVYWLCSSSKFQVLLR